MPDAGQDLGKLIGVAYERPVSIKNADLEPGTGSSGKLQRGPYRIVSRGLRLEKAAIPRQFPIHSSDLLDIKAGERPEAKNDEHKPCADGRPNRDPPT
jgi:hypothetical protein